MDVIQQQGRDTGKERSARDLETAQISRLPNAIPRHSEREEIDRVRHSTCPRPKTECGPESIDRMVIYSKCAGSRARGEIRGIRVRLEAHHRHETGGHVGQPTRAQCDSPRL
jgi:hypothetical protein